MIAEIAEGIYRIPTTPLPQGPLSDAFLVVGGSKLALVETSAASRIHEVVAGVQQAGYDPADLDYMIPTHIHMDHAGGLGQLAQRFTRPRVVLHEAGARHMIDPSRLIESTRQVFGDQYEEMYGIVMPVPADRVWTVRGGESIELEDRSLRMHAAPGHAPHHIVLQDSRTGFVFAGEAAGWYHHEGDVYTPAAAPPAFDPNLAIDTYRMVAGLRPARIVHSHCGVFPDVERALREAEETTRDYGDIVLAAVREGADADGVRQRLAAYLEGRIAISPAGRRLPPERRAAVAAGAGGMAVSAYTVYFRRAKLV